MSNETGLIQVREYVQKTAEIIGIIAEMEVLICDSKLRILGDSKEPYRGAGEIPSISAHSVLTPVMKQSQVVILDDVKQANPGCQQCQDREHCDIEAIIAIPVENGRETLGCIGIYAYEREAVAKLMEKNKTFHEFIDRMSDLLVGKVKEARSHQELTERVKKLSNNAGAIHFEQIIGASRQLAEVKRQAQKFAAGSSTILIQGESGTGKEIFARAIHSKSSFRDGPFIAVNCAAIPDNLLESELFGYEEGAFTGAMKGGRLGKFELADQGTLFLDEIGEIPIHLQSKFLRAVQERRIQRLGSSQEVKIEIRIIAATNRDLHKMVESGAFREDLYYRLNVIPLHIPPIRERKSDIADMCEAFLRRYNQVLGKNLAGFSPAAARRLAEYSWPGNVRELQNAVEYAVNLATGAQIEVHDLPVSLQTGVAAATEIRKLADVEDDCIRQALALYGHTLEGKVRAAAALGISKATLYRRIKEWPSGE